MIKSLNRDFFERDDVVQIAQDLLGCELVHRTPSGSILSGIITETEAYRAPEDKASHAFNNKRTVRTEILFQQGGICYVYLCYGIHHLINVVTNFEGIPHAVLIRAIFPQLGLEKQLENRKAVRYKKGLMTGPGKVSKALEIDLSYNGSDFLQSNLEIKPALSIPKKAILSGPRVGIDYAEEWVSKPWRFWIDDFNID